MRICKIWDADYPWDIRVEKVADSLAKAGHEVHLVCRNGGRLQRTESTEHFQIHRLPAWPSFFGPLHEISNFPHPGNPCWWGEIARVVYRYGIELILVRDLPLAIPAGVIGKMFGVPVVLDMAENYPAMLADRRLYTPTSVLGRMLRHPSLARLVERLSFPLMDHIIVVVDQSRDRLKAVGVPDQQLTVVTNTPRIDQWDAAQSARTKPAHEQGLHVVYLGNLDGSRGVDIAIKGIAQLKRQGSPAHLTIIGQGPSRSLLEKLVATEGVADRVKICGRLPFNEVQAVMAKSDVGIIPHYGTQAWNTTMPNKLFDYMLWGIPVLVSDIKAVSTIVEGIGCGSIFRDRDPGDFARCLTEMHPVQVRERMGKNGRRAIEQRYNWRIEEAELVRCIEQVRMRYQSA